MRATMVHNMSVWEVHFVTSDLIFQLLKDSVLSNLGYLWLGLLKYMVLMDERQGVSICVCIS